MYNEMFENLEILEKWYEESFITLKQYYEIKDKIIEKYK